MSSNWCALLKYDVIIIGAGLSGLAAGIRLAHFGKKTLIMERHYRVGGLNSFYRAGGYDLDVGLHAVTNFNSKGLKSAPLSRLMRRLRIKEDDLELCPQKESRITFPNVSLNFNNDIRFLTQQIEESFPDQRDGFIRLIDNIIRMSRDGFFQKADSGRKFLKRFITDPYLLEMIICPLMFYGNAREHDMDHDFVALMFFSLFIEGLSRPQKGIRAILDLLLKRYEDSGGKLQTQSEVVKIKLKDGSVSGVITGSDELIECDAVLSSAGIDETYNICREVGNNKLITPGVMSFAESIYILDKKPLELSIDHSIIFYNRSTTFKYQKPLEPINVDSGVICMPGNFTYNEPQTKEEIRVTHIANPNYWIDADQGEYTNSKMLWHDRSLDAVSEIMPSFRENIVYRDMFTPKTIKRFTGHTSGVVYGAPDKIRDGMTSVNNLYIIGTDQGFVGIVGAMIGGVEVVNRQLLV
jgi:phytoene dehydrogenase-like protein